MSDLLGALERERPGPYQEEFQSGLQLEAKVKQPKVEIERDPQQVFISHVHQDAEFAQRLATDLRACGFQSWVVPQIVFNLEKSGWKPSIEALMKAGYLCW